MNLLFLFPISDYFVTIKKSEFVTDFILPLIFTIIIHFTIIVNITDTDIIDNLGNIINLLAILIGFSITCITLLSSTGSKNVDDLKHKDTNRKIAGIPVTLYRLLLISFTYITIVEIFALSLNLVSSLMYSTAHFRRYLILFYTIDAYLLIHIVFVNVRNVTNIYFCLFKDEKVI